MMTNPIGKPQRGQARAAGILTKCHKCGQRRELTGVQYVVAMVFLAVVVAVVEAYLVWGV